ncbi:MAG: DEAD/DEAH box helicase [Pseudomonadota bacterium]
MAIFEDLGLKEEILKAIADSGYSAPTPIQEQAIPYVLQGRDIIGIAQTGTGKTASFTLPMIEMLSSGRAKARMPRSLILEPTRELAAQVAENFEKYGRYEKLDYALLTGGTRLDEQVRKLERGVDVLIATPGRMIDLFDRGNILLADVKVLVIDEADRMLDMGFIPDIERIVGMLPKIRQTLFFSATMPPEIRRLTKVFLHNPKEIAVAPPSSTSGNVEQGLVYVDTRGKREALRALLQREPVKNALIFCNRKRDIGILTRSLQRHGFKAGQLHGDMVQSMRTETLNRFKAGEIDLLVCSDVAARGIDIHELSHVFNFDIPTHAEDYVHRIGRTGRAGKTGSAYSLATSADEKYVAAITKLTGKAIPVIDLGLADQETSPSADTAAERLDDGPVASKSRRRRRNEDTPVKAEDGKPRRRNRRGKPIEKDEPDSPVIGLGDHVPAFLLRPVPKLGGAATAAD